MTLVAPDGESVRVTLLAGGPSGENAAGAGLNIFTPDGNQIVRLGTVVEGLEVVGSSFTLADAEGRPRIRLAVAPDGTPSIEMLDESGTFIWAAGEEALPELEDEECDDEGDCDDDSEDDNGGSYPARDASLSLSMTGALRPGGKLSLNQRMRVCEEENLC